MLFDREEREGKTTNNTKNTNLKSKNHTVMVVNLGVDLSVTFAGRVTGRLAMFSDQLTDPRVPTSNLNMLIVGESLLYRVTIGVEPVGASSDLLNA